MSDQWRGEKLPAGLGYKGSAVRERPIVSREGVGPWKGSVSVTYVQGAGWEVAASWEGPPLEVAGRADAHHLIVVGENVPAPAPVLANDVVYVGEDQELARAIEGRVTQLLRAPQRPNLPAIRDELKRRES